MAEVDGALILEGRAFPALSSRQMIARLTLADGQARLVSQDGSELAAAPARGLEWDMPVGRAPRRVRFPDGTAFETDERDKVDEARKFSGWTMMHRAGRFGRPLIIFVVLAALGGLMIWRFALPALVSIAVFMTPEPVRDTIDTASMKGLDRIMAEPTTLSAEKQAEITEIFETLKAELPPGYEHRDLTLHFRSTPFVGPNAFALPGGTVVMTDELVRVFSDPNVVAGVLAHEIGHVMEDHGLTQLYRSLGVFVLVSLIAGDTGPILEDVLLEGSVLLNLSFSREHERAADTFGLQLAQQAGYDPAGLLGFFRTLPDADDTSSSWLSTHPASGERMDAIRDFLDSN